MKTKTSNAIYREITFKSDCDENAQQCLDMLDRLDCNRQPGEAMKVCATGTAEGGGRTITVRFDDELDWLAFLAAIGAVTIKVNPQQRKDST